MSSSTSTQTMADRAREVAAWLNQIDRTDADPVTVTIGRATYPGATYSQTRDHSPGTRAYADAVKDGAPLTYVMRAIYLLGELPASYIHRHARAYVAGDASEGSERWYVSGWWSSDDTRMPGGFASDPDLRARGREAHPFGSMFMIAPDDYGVTATGVYGQPVIDRVKPMTISPVRAPIARRHWDSSCWQDLGTVDPYAVDAESFPAYAWPGGYQIAYVDPEDESEALCADTVREMVIAGDWPEGRTIDSQTYYEGSALECVCGKVIESAYGDPDAPEGAES